MNIFSRTVTNQIAAKKSF